ncbi:ABC-three component system protein [Hydrogenophaga sp. BPS33]|uniref:ABC-three component system protein n=1 Tax=Hydrogenophaga sp. BPS33 TaxID=2651974 RepID=UPI00131F7291|nr:ABC-three component system protein [Hydrogenophaga sp. BPS33]QHE87232.1 HNH endonuclease [Hydrogenophaga sp. BPS33]
MATARKDYGDNEHSILYGETNGCCPLCSKPILFRKPNSGRLSKGYEVAHIYPLNPTTAQIKALVDRPPPANINGLQNVIALCPNCHTTYDTDFQLDEMDKLRGIKDRFLADARANATISDYTIQQEVYAILDSISSLTSSELDIPPANFDATTVDKKLHTGMSPLQRLEIKTYAVTFYVRIRDQIRMLEQNDQAAIRLLQNQINTYYLAMQQQNPDNKDAVFNFVAQWISTRTRRPLLAAKVLTSFFVQNCEVFDASS